ncbi:hypothetical protein ISS07_05050, partial [Candidatus Woesearchaeota archaeon]|nr:hypothetical protein [Candidatus Woesearchaeota archaeon]
MLIPSNLLAFSGSKAKSLSLSSILISPNLSFISSLFSILTPSAVLTSIRSFNSPSLSSVLTLILSPSTVRISALVIIRSPSI